MTSRERWRAVLERQSVDRLPCDIWATDEVFEKLYAELDCKDRWEVIDKLGIDAPYTVGPQYAGPSVPEGYNIWGLRYQTVDYGAGTYGEVTEHPLANAENVRDIENHNWPSPDWNDYSTIKDQLKQHSHRPIKAGHIEPFLLYCQLRGLEQAMMDMVESPEMIECAFDHIFYFETKNFERILEQADGRIDIATTAEDLGSQTGPLFSIDCFRRFHRPRFQKYMDLAKQAGCFIFYHTDGASRIFIPDLIELGINILNPIQWNCPGMEREGLKADFGDKLVFHGGVDNQKILPFGTTEDVRNEVIRCFETMGIGGGYICAPCHNLQPNTPVENILTMYETIHEISSDAKYTRRS